MGLVEDVGTYLASQSTKFILGTDTYLNFLPDEPNRAHALYETGGVAPQFVLGASTKAAWENARFQLVCRSTSSTKARGDIDIAWTAFNKVVNQALSGSTYLRISAVQSPFLLERDGRGRVVFAVNFDAAKRR